MPHHKQKYWSQNWDAELEERLREALRRAEQDLDQKLKPAMQRLRGRMKDVGLEETISSFVGRAGTWAGTPGQPSAPPRSPNYAQERMTILKMVEQGKLTPEEAARLLDQLI